MNKIKDQQILSVLDKLHRAARGDGFKVLKALFYGIFTKIKPQHAKTAYLPVSNQQGEYMYDVNVRNRFQNIVEFGTSFGISTLYLAAAARETQGKVITSELLEEKCTRAQKNFDEAGLSAYIDLRQGNALETLKNLQDPIDFLLLDGWKDLYLPLFRLLEPWYHSKTIIFVDNTSFSDVRKFLKIIQTEPKYKVEKLNLDKGGSALITIK